MTAIVALSTERDRSNKEAIEMLEALLTEARSGDVIAVGLAIVRPSGHINCGFTNFDNAGLLLGATALLQSRLIANMASKE